MSAVPPDVLKELAPTGAMRVAINQGNTVLVQKDPATGAPQGITVDLAQALAERLGVRAELIVFDTAGKVFEALKAGRLDLAFLAIEPVRAAEIEFTAPYVQIEGVFMVRADSPIRTVAEVDRPGQRIAVSQGSAYDLYLTRTIKHATLVRTTSGPEAMAMFVRDGLEVGAGIRQQVSDFLRHHPQLRLIEPAFMTIRQAMGAPKGRLAGAAYLSAFIEEQKAAGFIAAALKRSGQSESLAAPPAGS